MHKPTIAVGLSTPTTRKSLIIATVRTCLARRRDGATGANRLIVPTYRTLSVIR